MEGSSTENFTIQVSSLINDDDILHILKQQEAIMKQLEASTVKMHQSNETARMRQRDMSEKFAAHQKRLIQMKEDLEMIFKKLKEIRTKIEKAHPQAIKYVTSNSANDRHVLQD